MILHANVVVTRSGRRDPIPWGEVGTIPRAPVFIVGADRSGTTMLRLCLQRHPALAIPSESWFLIDLMDAFERTDELQRQDLDRALAIVTRHPRWKRGWDTPAQVLRDELLPLAPMTLASFVDHLFRLETASEGKPLWGDKTPEYVFHVERLARLFPDAAFVHIVRDGRDVFFSLAARRWRDRGWTPLQIGRYWASCLRAAGRAAATLGPERFREVRYEDLVLDTRGMLRDLCEFLDLPFEEAMVDFHVGAERHLTAKERQKRVHDKISRRPTGDDVARWRRGGSPVLRWMAAGFMATGLRRYGYPEPPTRLPAAGGRIAAHADFGLFQARAAVRRVWRAAARRARRLATPVVALFRST